MEWISSTEFVEILKRFPNIKIEAKSYLGSSIVSTHVWEYHSKSDKFIYHIDGKSKQLSESWFLRKYASDHWRLKQFFYLTDEKQKDMAIHLVEHLIMTGNLDWIICDCDVQFLRECDHCHGLMKEGWMYRETYHYCSDECLLAENPEITQEKLDNLDDNNSDIYWTEWEE